MTIIPEEIHWRPASEPPPDSSTVLCLDDTGAVFVGYLDGRQWKNDHNEPCFCEVAFYAALPLGPVKR